jgi:large subunit ribosomal protein L16
MLLQPKILKYKKFFKLRDTSGLTKDNGLITLGEFGLKATESGILNGKQMETLRANILKKLKVLDKNAKVYMKVFPALPISKKPAEVRMGGGKGAVEFYGCVVKLGKVLVEVVCNGTSKEIKEILASSSNKLPFKTKVVERWV